MKSQYIVKDNLILFSYRSIHSNTATAHHYITWHLRILGRTFLGMSSCYFLMFSWIFSVSARSCSLAIRWVYQHYIFAVEVKNSKGDVAQFQNW